MINKIKYIGLLAVLLFSANTFAQNTTNSPYSQFGLGDLKPGLTPQFLGMGGVATGVRQLGGFNTINMSNPASYSAIVLSTFDIGGSLDFRKISNANASERTSNGTLSHLLMAIPVNNKSALSFGVMPYSDLGYQYRTASVVDTSDINYVYGGEGGLAKAHIGYGYEVAKGLSLGLNFFYLFGNLKTKQSVEFIEDAFALSSRVQNERSLGGAGLQYGIQYVFNQDGPYRLVVGYSGNSTARLKSNGSVTHFRYNYNAVTKTESAPIDTIYFDPAAEAKIKLPQSHTIGFSIEKLNKWLLGADFSYSKWSKFSDSGVNAGLNDSYVFSVGGMFTPDATSVSNYLKLVNYSLGFRYNRTYINIANERINQPSVYFGLGLPLASNRTAFYKINFSGEVGKRGKTSNGLVRENYLNLHLGFILNDRWFIKPKYD